MNLAILWPKLFVIVLLFAFYGIVRAQKKEKALPYILWILVVLLIRDLLYSWFKDYRVISFSDVVVYSLFLGWLIAYRGRRVLDIVFFILNGVVLVISVVDIFIHYFGITQLILNLWILLDIIYLSMYMGMVSEFNTENAEIIMRIRFFVISFMFVTSIITLLYGYKPPLIQEVLFPASYFIYFYILFNYSSVFVREKDSTIEFLSTNIEALFDFMKSLGSAITEKIDLPKVMDIIITSAVRNIGADAGVIMMVDEFEDVIKTEAIYGVYPPHWKVPEIITAKASSIKKSIWDTPIKIGETILGEAVKSGEAIYLRDATEDERMKYNREDNILFVSSIIVIPLIVSGRVLGVISAVKRVRNQYFSEADFEHLRTFAEYASITIDSIYTYMEILEKREMEREVGIAAEIQQRLIPEEIPEYPECSIAAFNISAKGVSGDYYDVIPLGEDKVGIFICDVAGKGVPAALVMVMIRTVLHLIISPDRDAATILTWINRGITGSISIDHFATLAYLSFDRNSREVVYSNAAHHPLLVYKRKLNRLIEIDTPGLPIGIEKSTKYAQKRFGVEKGDMVVLYTDGIIEAMNEAGEQYSIKSLKKIIMDNTLLSARELVDKIKNDLESFVGKARQHDDETIVVMKVN